MLGFQALTTRLADTRFGVAALALTLALAPACKKNKGTDAPDSGGSSAPAPGSAAEDLVKKAQTNELIRLANEDLSKGRYVSAAKRAEEALASDEANADAYAILGASRWRAGDFVGSTEAYEKAVELDAKNFGAVFGLIRNLQAKGDHNRAIELADGLLADDKEQVDPRLSKLWSYYALVDADNGVKELDEIFKFLPAEDPQLPLVQAYAAFLRPLEGKGPFFTIDGDKGQMDAGINHDVGMKYSSAIIGGEFSRVVFFENVEECIVDKALVDTLGLKSVGKITQLGQEAETDIVIVPEVKFGELTLKNVPAIVQPLDPYGAAIGEKPGLILGHQAMQAFGSFTFDYPANTMTVTKDAPAAAPDGAIELPFLLVSMHVLNAPVVPISIDGSEHSFFVYFGGVYGSGLAVTRKQYLKSGHLPRELDNPEDETNGLKMVYLEEMDLGGNKLGGMGGLVFINATPDQNLGMFLENTAFEMGGYINTRLISTWAVTYAPSSGKLFVKTP
jgi:tetratricopeptide (TPR) repeat protein